MEQGAGAFGSNGNGLDLAVSPETVSGRSSLTLR